MTYTIPGRINPDSARWLGAKIFGKLYSQISPEIATALPSVLKTIEPREAQIIVLRYGLDGSPAMTLHQIGDILGICRERVRQIEKHTVRLLRHPTRSRQLRKFILDGEK